MKPVDTLLLTVIIRNDAPLFYCGDCPKYRSVTFNLTEEQIKKIGLSFIGTNNGIERYEEISQCFIED